MWIAHPIISTDTVLSIRFAWQADTVLTVPTTAAMTIDVEDWFCVENLKPVIGFEQWRDCELRVQANVDRMLSMLEERQIACTFFILGWVARRCPALVRRIGAAGHEIACHGDRHELIYNISRDAFTEDVSVSRSLLEDITGKPVRGYRAPSFSITDWALDILQQLGFTYDSSWVAISGHERYGQLSGAYDANAISQIRPGFYEVPLATLDVAGKVIPWSGGGYFRLLPYRVFRRGVRRILDAGRPYVFYLHPWEIDPAQPRVNGLSAKQRFCHYLNLHSTEEKWAQLLDDFRWTSVWDVLKEAQLVSEPIQHQRAA